MQYIFKLLRKIIFHINKNVYFPKLILWLKQNSSFIYTN